MPPLYSAVTTPDFDAARMLGPTALITRMAEFIASYDDPTECTSKTLNNAGVEYPEIMRYGKEARELAVELKTKQATPNFAAKIAGDASKAEVAQAVYVAAFARFTRNPTMDNHDAALKAFTELTRLTVEEVAQHRKIEEFKEGLLDTIIARQANAFSAAVARKEAAGEKA